MKSAVLAHWGPDAQTIYRRGPGTALRPFLAGRTPKRFFNMEPQTNKTDAPLTEDGLTFAELLEQTYARDEVVEGEIVTGDVVSVTKDFVLVDVGYKSEGMIPTSEFSSIGGELPVKPGDKLDVLVESRENENGLMILSKEKADRLKVWDEISAACERDEVVEGTIISRVKGGLTWTSSLARSSSSRSSSSTRSAATSCSPDGPCSKRSAPRRKRTPCRPWKKTPSWKVWSKTSPNTAHSSIWAASTACFMSPT
jgi:hypothetical protein